MSINPLKNTCYRIIELQVKSNSLRCSIKSLRFAAWQFRLCGDAAKEDGRVHHILQQNRNANEMEMQQIENEEHLGYKALPFCQLVGGLGTQSVRRQVYFNFAKFWQNLRLCQHSLWDLIILAICSARIV